MFADCPRCGHLEHGSAPCRAERPNMMLGGMVPCLCEGEPSLPAGHPDSVPAD